MPDRPVRILGVPMDLGASRRGTDVGPSALRVAGIGAALRAMGLEVHREQDVQVPSMEAIEHGAGDASMHYKREIVEVCEELCKRVHAALDEGARPLVFGGDHSIAMGTVAGIAAHLRARQAGPLGLIWFDAHGDMNTPESSPSGNIHGMPLAHLLGMGDPALAGIGGFAPKVRAEHVALVGVRDLDRSERDNVRSSGVHVWTMREIDERGMAAVTREVLEVVGVGTAGFHLSFDVDGLDPEVVAGVGTPVPGGISFREAHLMLELLADHGGMMSMEVVELNPFLDTRNAGARTMRHLVCSAFGQSIL